METWLNFAHKSRTTYAEMIIARCSFMLKYLGTTIPLLIAFELLHQNPHPKQNNSQEKTEKPSQDHSREDIYPLCLFSLVFTLFIN